jgi:hypothetical protein
VHRFASIKLIPLIFVFVTSSCSSNAEITKNNGNENKGAKSMIINHPFFNPKLDSLLAYNLSAKGSLAWKLEYNTQGIPGDARSIILLDDLKLILDYSMVFFVIDVAGQKVLGFQSKSSDTFIIPINAQEFYAFSGYRLFKSRFDTFQTPPNDDYYIPGLGDFSSLMVFIPKADTYVSGIQELGNPRYSEKAFRFLEKGYLGYDAKWNLTFNGVIPKPPVSIDGRFVAAQNGIISIIGSDGKINNEIKGEFIPICCSIGIDNLIYLVYKTKSDYMIKAIDFEGKTRWECTTSISKPNQPPIVSRESNVYIIGDSKVEAFANGQKLWEFQLTGSDSSSQLASVSQDGMLLVSDGNRIICLNKSGELVWKFSIAKDGVFKTQPVLDSVGKVFVATDKSIFALK